MRTWLPIVILLAAGCSGQASKQDQLEEAANQSTPEAAQILNGAAENGMDPDAALNAAAEAQAGNTATEAPPRQQARPNSAENPNPPAPGQPPEKVPVNSQ